MTIGTERAQGVPLAAASSGQLAVVRIASDDNVAVALRPISAGDWVHSHNVRTSLSGVVDYVYEPSLVRSNPPSVVPTFKGYRRANGRVGTRNELWVLNTVGCVNHAAERIARQAGERFAGAIDGVHAFAHPYGC